jgi:acetyl-CoA carboxylase biotin carboxyl carrier protein
MDVKDVEKLVEIVEKEGLASIKIEDGDTKVEIKKQVEAPVQTMMPAAMPQPVAAKQPAAAPAAADAPAEAPVSGKVVLSPMSGTFYSSPSPDEPAFIKIGDQVNVGDVVCIVEAMKTFNRLESDLSGVVDKILVANGDPVEADQPLIALK